MKRTLIWIGALVVGAILGLLGIAWLDEVMNFVATVYTRLFQLLAVPTIVLAVITTFATFGSKGSGRIFGRTLTYTLLTTFAAAAVGAVLYVLVAPSSLPEGSTTAQPARLPMPPNPGKGCEKSTSLQQSSSRPPLTPPRGRTPSGEGPNN